MKILKRFIWIVSALIVVVVGLVFIAANVIEPNEYKQQIQTAVKQSTGRDLTIDGDLSVSFFPWIGADIVQLHLSNPPGYDAPSMLTVEQASVRIKLLSLLKQQIEVDTIVLKRPEVTLIRLPDGSTNWDDFIDDAREGGVADADNRGVGAAVGVIVQGVSIQDGQVSWDDRVERQNLRLTGVQLRMDKLVSGESADIQLEADFSGNVLPESGRIEFKTTARLASDLASVSLQETQLELALQSGAVKVAIGSIRHAIQAGLSVLTDLRAEIVQAQLTSNLVVPAVNFTASDGRLELPSAELTQGQQSIRLEGITGDNVLSDLADMSLSGGIRAVLSDPVRLLAANQLNVDLSPDFIGAVNLAAQFKLKNNRARLSAIDLRVDDMRLSGAVTVNNPAQPAYEFDLQLDRIDVDKLTGSLPSNDESAAPTTPPADPRQSLLLPVAPLHGLNADGRFAIGKLTAAAVEIDNIDLTVRSRAGRLELHPLRAELLGGTITGRYVYDVSGGTPVLRSSSTVSGVDVGALLAFLDVTDVFAGRGDVIADLSGRGRDSDAVVASLAGDIQVRLQDGAIKGYDLQAALLTLQDVLAGAGGDDQRKQPGAKTRFAEMSSDIAVQDGVFSTENLLITAPVFRVNGRGWVDLPAASLELEADVAVVGTLEGQGGAPLDQLEGVVIPLTVSGALAEPDYALDVQALLQGQVKERGIKALLEKVLSIEGGVKNVVPEWIEQQKALLKKLF